ncbi:MAG: GxxExxY protein [Candidatus Margulisiibacteriota bacterium]|jgi:GxxExxY protein
MAILLYPELSYKIMGVLFSVHNQLGPGFMEKHYQRGIENEFMKQGIKYLSQVETKIEGIGAFRLDFLVNDLIVVEIKATPRISRDDYQQIKRYLKLMDKELGILATFGRRNLIYRRILKGYK